jgi:hypothetical protein
VTVREPPLRVLPRLARELFHFLHAAELPHERFDVMRGAVQCDIQQHVFRGGRRHAGDRAHFRVAQLALTHGPRDLRQALERTGDPNLFSSCTQVEAALPAEPVGAGLGEAVRPAVAAIELRNQQQPAVIGRVQVTGEFGDLGLQFADRETGFGR